MPKMTVPTKYPKCGSDKIRREELILAGRFGARVTLQKLEKLQYIAAFAV